ncbi:MAG: helicase-related protein [Planctomycetota bacterium]
MYYQAPVVNVPTHLPSKRRCTGVCIFGSADEKRHAIVAAAKQITAKGRPVLVGTPSVEASELLSKEFQRNGIELQLLNAMMDADESKIIAGAGQRPVVTVATNMAGRGTDILLSDEVRAAGGLHVIMSEMHDSRRIDRQLIGRCARQGDPGTYELFLSAEDSIWQGVRTKMNLRFQDFQRRQRAIESDSSARRRRAFGEWTKQSKKLRRAGLDMYLEVPT